MFAKEKLGKVLFVPFILCVTLTGCAANEKQAVSDQGKDVEIVEPTAVPEKEESENINEAQMAYGKVLWDIYQQGILPDGAALEWDSMGITEENIEVLGYPKPDVTVVEPQG